jgi:hypothetical protein
MCSLKRYPARSFTSRNALIRHAHFFDRTGEAQSPQASLHGVNGAGEMWASLNVEDFDFHENPGMSSG